MKTKPRIIVLSRGEYSGSKQNLIAALEAKGFEVINEYSSLRKLRFRGFYILFKLLNSLVLYGKNFSKNISNTYFSYFAFSKANHKIVKSHENVDFIIQIGAYALGYWGDKNPDITYSILADHTNRLSKQIESHAFLPREGKVRRSWNKLENKIFLKQDRIFLLGSHVKESLIHDYKINPEIITIVGAGPNHDLDIERDKISKNYKGKNILFVGLDSKRKGLDVLMRAFAHVRNAFPDAALHIVGANGGSTSSIKYYGKLKGDPLKKLFYESQIFALPSFREPFGIVFLEAALSKCTCIGTDIEAMPEIIQHEETGYLIKPNDDSELADRIIHLFKNESILKRMGENGYRLTKGKWGWDKVADRILKSLSYDETI